MTHLLVKQNPLNQSEVFLNTTFIQSNIFKFFDGYRSFNCAFQFLLFMLLRTVIHKIL